MSARREQLADLAAVTASLTARSDAAEAQLDAALAVARLPWRSTPQTTPAN